MKKEVVINNKTIIVDDEGNIYNSKGDRLKTEISNNGYERVCLGNDRKKFLVHRLVALCFVENPNNYKYCNHINGDKRCNKSWNIEWCTSSHNQKEAYRLGLRLPNKGEKSPTHKLTEEQVFKIREEFLVDNNSCTNLGEKYKVHRITIYDIVTRKTWKHI